MSAPDVMTLNGKVAFVTGAARGMGEAEARLFVERGARVVIADVLDEEGRHVAHELGDSALYLHLDVSRSSEWERAMQAALSHFGRLDVMVGNAGISPPPKPIEETTEEEYRRVIEINQLGCFSSIKHSIAPMKQAGAGSIILISSTAGIDAVAGIAAYTSSKFAVKSLARVAALELGRSNIRVNTVHPGPIDTAMSHWGGHDMRPALAKGNPMGRIGTPREVAEVVAFLASDASSYCTGGAFSVDGGETAGVFVQYDDPTAQ